MAVAVDFGVVETPADMDFEDRLFKIHQAVRELAAKHQPAEAAIETLFFSKNTKTALKVAEARGVIRLALKEAGIPALECSPQSVKTALAGFGAARLLGLDAPPRPDDAADALGLALTAIRSKGMRRMAALAVHRSSRLR